MALIQYGIGVQKASGKLAGTVFSNNKGGSYVRRFSVPTNPNTVRQQDQRTVLGNASSAWRLLSSVEQDAWKAWAQTNPIVNRLGASIILTGSQAYTQIASNIGTYDAPSLPLVTPPADPAFVTPVEAPGSLVLTAGGALEFDTGVARAAGDIFAVYASPPISAGRTFTKNLTRLILVDPVAAPILIGATIDLQAAYEAVWGSTAAQVGKKIVFEFYSYSNGRVSVTQSDSGLLV